MACDCCSNKHTSTKTVCCGMVNLYGKYGKSSFQWQICNKIHLICLISGEEDVIAEKATCIWYKAWFPGAHSGPRSSPGMPFVQPEPCWPQWWLCDRSWNKKTNRTVVYENTVHHFNHTTGVCRINITCDNWFPPGTRFCPFMFI